MQLSMELLNHGLAAMKPEASIRDNARRLNNVRLFSENIVISPLTVYLEPMETGRILCINNNDILTLHTDDINEALNAILDLFDSYNNFEAEINRMIDAGCSAAELLGRLSEQTGFYLILADASFYMMEAAGPESILNSHTGLTEHVDHHMLPLPEIGRIAADPRIHRHTSRPYTIQVEGLGTALVTNLFNGRAQAGWLIACSMTGAYRPDEADLLDAVCPLMERWFARNQDIEARSVRSGTFLSLLEGNDPDPGRVQDRLTTFGWKREHLKEVLALIPASGTCVPEATLKRRLEIAFPDAFVLSFQGRLLAVINLFLTDPAGVPDTLTGLLRHAGYAGGISRTFCDMADFVDSSRMALLASDHVRCEPGTLMTFREAMLPYILSLIKKQPGPDPVHPALRELHDYDLRHHTQLYGTLQTFLKLCLNYTDTAAALYIHRSTLLYRLDKIRALTGIDLSDPDERLHLELSYALDK